MTTAVIGGLAAIVALVDINNTESLADDDSIFQVSVGAGLYLALLAAVAALIAGVVSARKSP